MKEIEQEEFENLIRQIIEGKKSETRVIKELETGSRTFNNRIQELSIINPELYEEFIRVHPYKPKERKDINIRGFVIEILKSGITVEEMCTKYGIGRRTISRKILELKKSDNEEDRKLYELYKRIAYSKSHSKEMSIADKRQIEELEKEEVVGIDNIERRRQELLELEKKYQDLCLQVGKTEAAKRLGYTKNRIYKLLNELYRIEIERIARESNNTHIQDRSEKSFRDSMKVEGIRTIPHSNVADKDENLQKDKKLQSQEEK